MTEARLELESVRTATFVEWPLNAPVSAKELVTNGFFATGNWLEAECNWCHVRIDRWEYGDQVAERHRRCSPICSMVLAPNHCGNVTLSQENDSEGNSMVDGGNTSPCACPDLLVEANRLQTFKDWPNPNVTPQALAKAGFYYLNRLDHVKCVWCNGIIAKWEKNDNAFEEHRRFFPNCPRVQMGPLIEFAGKNLDELGILPTQPTTQPQRPKYACVDARMRTFNDWPIGNIQPPVPLAQAGLFYQKIGDQVRCFHCNIGLRSWQKEDEPWHEHAKWSPKCQYVLLAKGPSFVREVHETMAASSGSQIATAPAPHLDALMDEGPAKEALALGIDGGVVRNTIQRKLSSSGCAFESLDELLHAIFDEAGCETGVEVREPTEPTAPPLDCCRATTSKAAAASEVTQIKPEPDVIPQTHISEQMQRMSLASPNGNISLEEENRQLKDARLCKVCLDEEVGVVFLPCGHLATCNQCAPSVANCPMCRADIKGFVRTFLS